MRAIATGLSDVGLQREHNEDSFVVLNEYDLYIVADGMGGHRAGDVASRLATDTIAEFFKSTANDDVTWPFHFDTSLSEEENRLAHRHSHREPPDLRAQRAARASTTAWARRWSARSSRRKKNRMYIGHVGDSRCYRIRGGEIQQLTRDHSLINDYLMAMPDLTEEQTRELPKNVITRALGMQDQVMVDLQADEPQPGDVYLLCSDGLSGMVADDEILDIVISTGDIGEGCRRLIARANEHGGEDNITAVLVRIDDGPSPNDQDSTNPPPPLSGDETTMRGPLPPVAPKIQEGDVATRGSEPSRTGSALLRSSRAIPRYRPVPHPPCANRTRRPAKTKASSRLAASASASGASGAGAVFLLLGGEWRR